MADQPIHLISLEGAFVCKDLAMDTLPIMYRFLSFFRLVSGRNSTNPAIAWYKSVQFSVMYNYRHQHHHHYHHRYYFYYYH